MLTQSLLTLLVFTTFVSCQSCNGVTTRYWDCCKPSCSWPGKALVTAPVAACNAKNDPLADFNAQSSCTGGPAYACADNSPWAVSSTLAYGFAAVKIQNETEADWCCQCYALKFTSGAVAGKTMIVQATNTGGDLGTNQFDLMIPGGGVGTFNGCVSQYGLWNGGAQYGGISARSDCANLPGPVRAGCYFRFDWFLGADNPSVTFTKTTCPSELASITGCARV